MKNYYKNILLAFLVLSATVLLSGNQKNYKIYGKIYNITIFPLYINLVDKYAFDNETDGIAGLIITPSKANLNKGYYEYCFENIKPGIYGIQCFQDKNGNKKLDLGIFGPKEPWGISWNKKKLIKIPKFKDFSFEVINKDIEINIVLSD